MSAPCTIGILDSEFFCQILDFFKKNFVDIQYFDKKISRSLIDLDLNFYRNPEFFQFKSKTPIVDNLPLLCKNTYVKQSTVRSNSIDFNFLCFFAILFPGSIRGRVQTTLTIMGVWGRKFAHMSTLLNNCYSVKLPTEASKLPQILSAWFVHAPKK